MPKAATKPRNRFAQRGVYGRRLSYEPLEDRCLLSVAWGPQVPGAHAVDSALSQNAAGTLASTPAPARRVVGYLQDWEFADLGRIDLSALTQLNYFSIIANGDGSLPTISENGDSLSELQAVVSAAHAASPRVAVSITLDPKTPFLSIAQNAASTTAFVNNLISFCSAYHLDGIDLDYEPGALSAADETSYGNLVAAIHAQTSTHGLTLSAAVQAYQMIIPAADISCIDWYYVMDYPLDFNSSAPYDESIAYLTNWANYGVPKSELLMGVPFFGESGASWSATSDESYAAILSSYYAINGVYPDPNVDTVTASGVTWGFNGVSTIREKAQYVLDNGYGGIMIWSLAQDHFNAQGNYDQRSLLPVIKSVLAPQNRVPTAAVSTPSGTQSGNVTISYRLLDNASDPCSVLVQYSTNGGGTWHAATQGAGGSGTSGLASLPGGSPHTFVWASGSDIGNAKYSNVQIRITPSDAGGPGTAGATNAFTVDNSPSPIGSVVIAEIAVPKNGVLEADEPLKITWAMSNRYGIASQTVAVDGRVIAPTNASSASYGPYGPYGGVYYYRWPIGALSAGSHTYTIQTSDALHGTSRRVGTFTVAAPVPPLIASVVIAAAAAAKNGILESNEKLRITWAAASAYGIASQTMTVDGHAIAPINGPYGGLYYSCPIGMWSAGRHTYSIRTTDFRGISFGRSGTFTVLG